MRLGVVKRILKESVPGAPGWLDSVLSPLNQFMEQVSTALDKRLTFADNFMSYQTAVSLKDDTEKGINPQSALRVTGVLLLSSEGEMVTGFRWVQKSDGSISVKVKYATAGAEKACLLLFLFG